jgi:hypothetical protein
VVASGCDWGPRAIRPPALKPAAAAQAAIEQYDANKDGKISGEELDKCPGVKCVLDKLNPKAAGVVVDDGMVVKTGANKAGLKDEGVTAEMLQNMMEGWIKRRYGRVTFVCAVYHNGKPLQGATIKFVPEKFLGSGIPAAEGKTGDGGTAAMSIPNVKPEGITVGFYRVEVTKDGEAIPAKYNTESTLGAAAIASTSGIAATFNLKY